MTRWEEDTQVELPAWPHLPVTEQLPATSWCGMTDQQIQVACRTGYAPTVEIQAFTEES